MDCYLINLDRSPDRLAFMQAQFKAIQEKKLGASINLIRVAAVDASKLSDSEISEHYEKDRYSFNARFFPNILPPGGLTNGEIACFYSHRKCWQEIINKDSPYAVVLEDDVIFSKDIDVFFGDTTWIPEDADIVKLEVLTKKLVVDVVPAVRIRGKEVSRFHSSNLGTAAYIISRSAAEKLLKMTDKFYLPIDHVMFGNLFPYFKEFKCYQVIPAICIQDVEFRGKDCVFKSIINNRRDDKFFRRFRKKIGIGAKIKREFVRFVLQMKSRTGIRKKIINTFNREEAFYLNNRDDDKKNQIEDALVIKPVFSENPNAVVFTLDRGYMKQLGVMLQSLIEHTSSKGSYDIIILENGFTDQDKKIFSLMCQGNISIRFFDITSFIESCFQEVRLYAKSWWSKAVWYKCFMPFILKGYKKVCCLDVDAVLQYDVNSIFSLNMADCPLFAVRDVMSYTIESPEKNNDLQYLLDLGIKRCTDYFNGGMLVFNLEVLDIQKYSHDFLEMYKTRSSFRMLEQDVLNCLFNQKVTLLPFIYNYQVQVSYNKHFFQNFKIIEKGEFKEICKSPKFIHYFGAIKPWHLPGADIEYYDLFWSYAEKTPFYQALKEEAEANAKQLAVLQDKKKSIRFSYIKEKILAGLASGDAKERHEQERLRLKNQMVKIKAMSNIERGQWRDRQNDVSGK